jgi:RNA polymerase sigma-70 factor (ECF subfamily)
LSQEELAELYRSYGHLVLRRCRAILRDQAAAEDALQEAFVRAMRYGPSLERADSKLGWLYRAAERCCFDRLRTRKKEVPVVPEVLSSVAQQGLPQGAAEAREVVLAFLGRFDPKVQQVAVLHYLDELPQETIAEQLGWSRRTVGKKLDLVRKKAESLARTLAPPSPGGPP